MPRLLGRYQLEHRLAEGGMAEVWLATAHGEAGFTRRVAIKQLFAPADDGGAFARMFLDEARITSRLHHASIVAIVDFGIEAGRPFQVLELIDGFDSARLERWGRAAGAALPVGLALHVCAVVGHALHFAHVATDEAGAPLNIVHRDVSPQNVLISRSGDVKLSDFGIAFAEGRAEKTVGAVSRGKPAYMAPEQAVRGAMDGRTDVFALGCVLHALVTGESALRDENALVDLLAGQELSLHPQLPEAVRAIIARATRRNRAERFESAEVMALACSQQVPTFLAEEPRLALQAWVRAVAPAVGAAQNVDGATPRVGAAQNPEGALGAETSTRAQAAARPWPVSSRFGAGALLATGLLLLGGVWLRENPPANATGDVAATPSASTPPREPSAEPPIGDLAPKLAANGAAQLTDPAERVAAPTPNNAPGAAQVLDAEPRGAASPAGPEDRPGPVPRIAAAQKRGSDARPGDPRPTGAARAPDEPMPTGIFAVGGELLLGGEVFIDGQARGFAPGRFELAVGTHRVEVFARDGTRHGPRDFKVTRQHTQSSALQWQE